MTPKKELSIEEIQELLDVATTELLNFFIRDKVITIDNPSTKYTLEDSCSFIEITLTAKPEKRIMLKSDCPNMNGG